MINNLKKRRKKEEKEKRASKERKTIKHRTVPIRFKQKKMQTL